jgi:hypothetical protein
MPATLHATKRHLDTLPLRPQSKVHMALRQIGTGGEPNLEQIRHRMEMREHMPISTKQLNQHVLKRLCELHAVQRLENGGWEITDRGREILIVMDGTMRPANEPQYAGTPAGPRNYATATASWNEHYLSDRTIYRQGALDYRSAPSRMGNRLVHRDGRTTDLEGSEVAA